MAMRLKRLSILALFTFIQLVLSQWKCDHRAYGRPHLDHCASTLASMPDALSKSPTELSAYRKFVEPQYLEPPFAPCHNELDARMEQLPKFWRYSQLDDPALCGAITTDESKYVETCRFVLTPLADSTHQVLDPEPTSTWFYVLDNAHVLSTNCVAKKLGGGVIFIKGLADF